MRWIAWTLARDSGGRAALLHRDREVSPTGIYPALEGGQIPAGIGPTSVVRERPLPNRSGSFGKYARTSDDPALQGGCGLTAIHMARDRPSPYVKRKRFFIVARGPVPRDVERVMKRPQITSNCPTFVGQFFSPKTASLTHRAGTFAENGFHLGEQLPFRRVHLETACNNVVVGILRGPADRTHIRFMIPEAHRLPPLLRLIHL